SPVVSEQEASTPASAPSGAAHRKAPFYKLVWFWVAMALAVFSLCCLVVTAGALAFGGRANRSGMMKMRMQDSLSMQDGRGMRNGAMMGGPKGADCGGAGSQESTACPEGNGCPRGY
ncbi:MAG: hypothetical protein FWC48_02325, partial [Actinomycetia bacterium]|nr:hypothetical protein [Actinomycetes bacterium]